MELITSKQELRKAVNRARQEGKKIGLVPTMGYLHRGHLSLIERAIKDTDFVVVSIFVNPLQFGAGEDYEEYPRDLRRDSKLVEELGADVVFAPSVEEMYGSDHGTYVEVFGLTERLCGASRPGHFKGVTTVVSKLFNLVQPDLAFFGQKDAQQVAVLKKMVKDLDLPVEIIALPIVREEDGLALSSRNKYLNSKEREAALVLFKSLQLAEKLIGEGERQAEKIRRQMVDFINSEPLANIDYVEICSVDDLKPLKVLKGKIMIALAVKIGKTRLIDNLQLEVE
ncbi:MAG TPA: pantoate--beta-alanine ligase [Clostridia bacterium]|jgi:pantoate--beta-alanine ligase|nr:pantoate--beta-alanine ligase [Clostridia bacterium]